MSDVKFILALIIVVSSIIAGNSLNGSNRCYEVDNYDCIM